MTEHAIEVLIPTRQYGNVKVRANSTADAVARLQDAADNGLFELAELVAARAALAAGGLPATTVTPASQPVAAPQPQAWTPQPAPAPQPQPAWPVLAPAAPQSVQVAPSGVGAAPTCTHGPRVHRTGVSARGQWAAWFCSQPKGSIDQCKPVFV